jgi:hypothetical protein
MNARFREAELRHAGAAGTAQQANENLIDHQGGEQFGLPRLCHQLD